MLLTFWFNNFHFALEFFGAVVFFILSWLSFDAFLVKKEFKTFSRGLGFLFFASWEIINSLNLNLDFYWIIVSFFYIAGLFFILLNLWLEKPPQRPVFQAVIFLPTIPVILWGTHIIATIFLVFVTVLAVIRLKGEAQKLLKSFAIAFALLTAASFLAVLTAKTGQQDYFWLAEHALKFAAFSFLAYWGWQYLKLRLKEEMILIFIGMALLISIIVTFTFSAILLTNMENEAELNLVSNVKVLEYTFSRMKNEALATAQFFAENEEIKNLLSEKDFSAMEKTAENLMAGKTMDFLTIADEDGEVILRTHSLTAKGDNIKEEAAGAKAFGGADYATIEPTAAEGMSIRAAAPVYDSENKIAGVIVTGFIIDNAFVDKIKKNTGLEASIYSRDALSATTIAGADEKTRNIGAKQTDPEIIKQVLEQGKGITQRTTIFSRPYLASYLPLKNAEGKIIGMLESSRLQTELAETAAGANRLTLLITIIITLIILMPVYLLSKKITEEA